MQTALLQTWGYYITQTWGNYITQTWGLSYSLSHKELNLMGDKLFENNKVCDVPIPKHITKTRPCNIQRFLKL